MSGELVVKYEYDAWGNIISETNASGGTLSGTAAIWNDINPFRYRGYYYDAETGLYYLQSRYYDAETGRFINQDSYISTGTGLLGFNMFAYCDNNPVNFSDPTGEKLFECCPHGDCASCKKKKKKAVYIRRTSSGKDVYISKDSEFQAPSGGIKVIDKRDTNMTDDKHNPAMEIENSFKIVDENLQENTIDILIQYNNEYPSTHKWTRSKNSLIKEWKGHNVAYRIASAINHEGWKISAQHVGLDEFNDFEFIWEVISPLNSCL